MNEIESADGDKQRQAALMRWHCKCRKDPSIRECVYGECLVYVPEARDNPEMQESMKERYASFKEMLNAGF